eukprot:tig00020961_g16729.t1
MDTLLGLPDECLVCVLERLGDAVSEVADLARLCALRLVCRRLRGVVDAAGGPASLVTGLVLYASSSSGALSDLVTARAASLSRVRRLRHHFATADFVRLVGGLPRPALLEELLVSDKHGWELEAAAQRLTGLRSLSVSCPRALSGDATGGAGALAAASPRLARLSLYGARLSSWEALLGPPGPPGGPLPDDGGPGLELELEACWSRGERGRERLLDLSGIERCRLSPRIAALRLDPGAHEPAHAAPAVLGPSLAALAGLPRLEALACVALRGALDLDPPPRPFAEGPLPPLGPRELPRLRSLALEARPAAAPPPPAPGPFAEWAAGLVERLAPQLRALAWRVAAEAAAPPLARLLAALPRCTSLRSFELAGPPAPPPGPRLRRPRRRRRPPLRRLRRLPRARGGALGPLLAALAAPELPALRFLRLRRVEEELEGPGSPAAAPAALAALRARGVLLALPRAPT